MTRIYLCDLANELIDMDNKSIPIGVGYVAAYCKHRFAGDVDVQVFRTHRALWDRVRAAAPDIIGLGSYDWNSNLSLKTAAAVKEVNPNCMTVLGGANASAFENDTRVFLEGNPQIDYAVYGDGEFPFAHLVERHLQFAGSHDVLGRIKEGHVNGARTLCEGELVGGEMWDLVEDLDEIPSPYLTGLFDDLLQDERLMPIVQNVRGCPYSCRFCVSGLQAGKIRHFSYERVTAEIDYLRRNAKNRFLRLSDDNFGIIEHDIEVAKYIRDSFDNRSYPLGLKAYSAKKLTERTRRMALILKPLALMCISFQTMTKEVLKETKRYSASVEEALVNIEYARKHGIATGTELIFGLPGETLESMKEVLNHTLRLRFDSVALGPLWMLKGADLYRPESRAAYDYRTRFMIAENAVTINEDILSVETDEIVVSSKYFTFEEWQRMIHYQFILGIAIYFGYARDFIYHAISGGIEATDLLDEILDNPAKYPTVCEAASGFVDRYVSHMFESQEEAIGYIKSNVEEWRRDKQALSSVSKHRMVYDYITRHMFDDPENGFLNDIHRAILNLYDGESREEFEETTDLLLDLTIKQVVNPRLPFVDEMEFPADYHVSRWIQDAYERPLFEYRLPKAHPFLLRTRNPQSISHAIARDQKLGRTDCFTFFRYLNSSLRCRIIVDEGVPEFHLEDVRCKAFA